MMAKDIALFVVFIGVVSFGIWGVYMLVKISGMSKQERDDAQRELDEAKRNTAPYKVEPTPDVAVSDVCEDNSYFRPDHFEPYCKPKRKYTKRSGFWTDKRKKAAARKAKKKTRKSK
jgi:hypothetical protein